MNRSATALAAVVSVLPATAVAQPGCPPDTGCAIVVTGRLPDPQSDRAYDVVRIGADRLATVASGRVEDALKDVAGLQQFRRSDARSANATSQGATLRGLGGNASSRALLVLDGVPQSDPFGGWVTWPAYGALRLNRIVVTRGGGSGAYGSGALSGTIELESIADGTGPIAVLHAGSRQSVEGEAVWRAEMRGGGFGFVGFGYARSDGFVPIIAAQRGPVDIAAPYEQGQFSARGRIPVSDEAELQASFLAFSDSRNRGTLLSGNGGRGADASVQLVHRGDWQASVLGYLQLRKFRSRFVAIDAARTAATQTVNQFNVPSTGSGLRFEVRPPLGEEIELRLGGDWRRTSGETNELFTFVSGQPTRRREAGGQSDTAGGFAELTGRTGRLTLTASGRIDRWWIRNGRLLESVLATGAALRAERPADRQGWEPTGRAGLVLDAGRLRLRAAAYLGWRLPTLNELYRPFRVGADATAANAALRPETMRGAEAGFDWEPAEGLLLRATLFENRLTDAIANVTLGAGPGVFPGVGFVAAGGAYRQRLNVGALRSRGVELDAAWRSGDWSLTASYALADARIRAGGAAAALDGLRPAQVPRHLASATIGWRGLSATLRHVSAQFEDDGNTRRLAAATTLDAVARIPLSSAVSVVARGENLGNARVEAAISGTGVIERAAPRTLWIGISYRD
jgi:outer membrane receptor protein involved in Fe transport